MIWVLLLKTFIPVSKIFDNEDDIFIFSRNVRKSRASENYLFKKSKTLWNIYLFSGTLFLWQGFFWRLPLRKH